MAKLVLDPGHSGNPDSGAVGPTGLRESDVNMDIANILAGFLTADGYEVILTREGDDPRSDDLAYRTDMANWSNADLYLSIHCNAVENPQARGTETYHYTMGSWNSKKFAQFCQTELIAALGLNDRGVKAANYFVLRETNMPACLVEIAFISNPDEEEMLRQQEVKTRAAMALYKATYKYFKA